MLDMAQDNIETSFDAVLSRDSSLLTKAEKMESYLDFLNKEISKYISVSSPMRPTSRVQHRQQLFYHHRQYQAHRRPRHQHLRLLPSCWRNGTSSSPPRRRRRSARCGTSVWRR